MSKVKLPHLVVLTGAGVSAESGISTFRDSGGLWDKYPVMDVASADGFARNPALVHEFYNTRRRELLSVEPNDAHRSIARLEKWYDVDVITQNVDNLHERGGSTRVLHLHGELKHLFLRLFFHQAISYSRAALQLLWNRYSSSMDGTVTKS